MIPYHGLPITPDDCAIEAIKGGHAFVSYAAPQQLLLAMHYCQSFGIDNGAFNFWKNGITNFDWAKFYAWLRPLINHPRLDFFVIPDVIEGTEEENDTLIAACPFKKKGAPVWHTNESPERLQCLAKQFSRVCIGSSGEYDVSGKAKYIARIKEVLAPICDRSGYPITRIHLLRGLNPEIYTKLPAASADSTNVGRNIGIDSRWKGTYQPRSKRVRTRILVDRIEHYNSACRLIPEYDL